MTSVLGISAFYHDSAAALVVDGKILAAAQEERFSRRKHDAEFPNQAIKFCLAEAGITAAELDLVAFYEKPFLKFERILETQLAFAPRGWLTFLRSMPVWVKKKLLLSRDIKRELGGGYRKRIVFPEHHQSHAASAFFASPFDEAAILTIDGVGEWATTTWGTGRGNSIELCEEIRFPHSLGLLYSTFTAFCGFRVNGGEGKLMGLAPYGQPVFADAILNEIIDLKDDGSFRLDLSYFDFCVGSRMWSRKFENLFGGPPRLPDSEITQREKDLAASIQQVCQDAILLVGHHIHQQTQLRQLCFAGGVALNCVANGVLMRDLVRDGPFDEIFVPPAPGDAGGAIGAALFASCQLIGDSVSRDRRSAVFLGPQVPANWDPAIDQEGIEIKRFENDDGFFEFVSEQLASGKIVGWVQGRMEFGPRALGSRSILADPRNAEMKSVLNDQVKFREGFRPFAPAVIDERAGEFFEMEFESPLMNFAANVRAEMRSVIPAVTHVDGTARVQTVSRDQQEGFWMLLKAFEQLTDVPVLVNTSFNVRGEPIVCTAEDALSCFLKTGMDVLVIERTVLIKCSDARLRNE